MDRDELPGYEFDAPHGPRHASGRRPEFGRGSGGWPEDSGGWPEDERGLAPGSEFGRDAAPWPDDFAREPVWRPQPGRDVAPRFESRRDLAPRSEFVYDLAPRSEFGYIAPKSEFGADTSFRGLRTPPAPEPRPADAVREASRGVLDVMRQRNWVMGLAVPVLAAIAVGIAVVVATGGGGNGGGQAPSALAAGFEPARLAGGSFTGPAGTSRSVLSAIGVSGSTLVTAGSVNSAPAVWTSTDGATDWSRAKLATRATGQLAGVAHGSAGWLAVGTTEAGGGELLVVSSPNAATWTAKTGPAKGNAAAVAAGPAGYVIVGHGSVGGAETAAAWFSPGLTGLRPATVTADVDDQEAQAMNAVTAVAGGFVAVGQSGANSAAWLTSNGKSWQQVQVPPPNGAARSALSYVAADGETVVAAGTEFSTAGTSSPFTEVSTDGGKTWAEVDLPVPGAATGTVSSGSTVTALTAAAGGFTAAGTYNTQAGPEVVIWTLPPTAEVTNGASWTEVTPQGIGLSSTKSENTLTALTVDGATLTGVGFTAPLSASGAPEQEQPTLWQSPVRY